MGETKEPGENLPQRHLVHHNSLFKLLEFNAVSRCENSASCYLIYITAFLKHYLIKISLYIKCLCLMQRHFFVLGVDNKICILWLNI
jgi:hypothetical protein